MITAHRSSGLIPSVFFNRCSASGVSLSPSTAKIASTASRLIA